VTGLSRVRTRNVRCKQTWHVSNVIKRRVTTPPQRRYRAPSKPRSQYGPSAPPAARAAPPAWLKHAAGEPAHAHMRSAACAPSTAHSRRPVSRLTRGGSPGLAGQQGVPALQTRRAHSAHARVARISPQSYATPPQPYKGGAYSGCRACSAGAALPARAATGRETGFPSPTRVARTAGQDAEHVLQAQRRQLERPLVAGAQDVERRRAVGHRLGAAVAHVPPDDLRGARKAAHESVICAPPSGAGAATHCSIGPPFYWASEQPAGAARAWAMPHGHTMRSASLIGHRYSVK